MAEAIEITDDTSVRKHDDVLDTELDGEIVVMSIDTGKYFGLDAIGSAIWRRIEAPIRVGAVIDSLAAEFDGDTGAIRADTLAFLTGLAERQLIEIE